MTQSFNLNQWIEQNLFDALPMSAVVIDTEYNVVKVNRDFEGKFGAWQHKKCYEVYKHLDSKCPHCKGVAVFEDGIPRAFEDISRNQYGKKSCQIRKTFPVIDDNGKIPYIIETTTDISDTELIHQKYLNLFEHVPYDILIINKNFKIIEINKKTRSFFGPIEGAYCYEILKNRSDMCDDCMALRTFSDGQMHSGRSTVIDKEGKPIELLVTTVPFEIENGISDYVLEMAVDITETLELQEELKMTNTTMISLISSSLYGIIAVDENDNITVFNQAAERMLDIKDKSHLRDEDFITIFPKGFLEKVSTSEGPVYLHETKVCNINGDSFPARLTGIKLLANEQYKGKAFWIHDIRRIKKLEAENLEAERLAAVGKTVAGLAHGIKNVLTGLEGGEYMLNSGLQKGDAARIQKGMEMLNRNTKRVSTFVKEFLNFSKGQEIKTGLCDPVEIAREVVNTYSVKIRQLGIKLVSEFQDNIGPAALDEEGMHECLSNLLGNAIDACCISENPDDLLIIFRVYENDNSIVYEVVDNGCGMDYEIKRKIFTTFFTTKGLGGTGLGLLMTKKIIQQHGGKVDFDSVLDQGTTFKITLPRDRLPEINQPDNTI
ncbi:PAS domain S-box protein [bacterium]|nr:PAS domain S-box protein [bacterium]